MKLTEWIIVSIFAACVIGLVVLKMLNVDSRKRGVLKIISSALFVTIGVIGYVKDGSTEGLILLIGLIFAFFGDVFLIFMDKRKWFILGVASFSCASLTFSVLSFICGKWQWWFLVPMILSLIANSFCQIKNIYSFGSNLLLLNIYTCFVTMCGSLGLTQVFVGGTKFILFGLGCFLYFISDFILGLYLFKFRNRYLDSTNTLTYFPGLLLIAISLLV